MILEIEDTCLFLALCFVEAVLLYAVYRRLSGWYASLRVIYFVSHMLVGDMAGLS
jgi:hypothetical protein